MSPVGKVLPRPDIRKEPCEQELQSDIHYTNRTIEKLQKKIKTLEGEKQQLKRKYRKATLTIEDQEKRLQTLQNLTIKDSEIKHNQQQQIVSLEKEKECLIKKYQDEKKQWEIELANEKSKNVELQNEIDELNRKIVSLQQQLNTETEKRELLEKQLQKEIENRNKEKDMFEERLNKLEDDNKLLTDTVKELKYDNKVMVATVLKDNLMMKICQCSFQLQNKMYSLIHPALYNDDKCRNGKRKSYTIKDLEDEFTEKNSRYFKLLKINTKAEIDMAKTRWRKLKMLLKYDSTKYLDALILMKEKRIVHGAHPDFTSAEDLSTYLNELIKIDPKVFSPIPRSEIQEIIDMTGAAEAITSL